MSNIKPVNLSHEKNGFVNFLLINKVWLVLLIIALLGIFFWENSRSSSSVFSYVTGQKNPFEKKDSKINVLLLGMAGGKHDGATLTDTIMVVSFDTKTEQVNLISLPRDLWVDSEKSKINALYQKGLTKNNGLKYAEEKFSEILGMNIPYTIRVDFSGFIKAVDLIGGIDVFVANSFDDYLYPVEGKENDYCGAQEKDLDLSEEQAKQLNLEKGIHQVLIDKDGDIATVSAVVGGKIEYTEDSVWKYFPCRYEHVSFTKGLTSMDGTTALKFVRSRHGINGEGSDFARSKRQQLVLQAFNEKVLSMETLTDVQKIVGLINTFGQSVETDIPQSRYLEFAGMLKKIKEVRTTVISSEGKNPFLAIPAVGAYGTWVLIPPNNDFSAIKNYLSDFINNTDSATKSAIPISPTP